LLFLAACGVSPSGSGSVGSSSGSSSGGNAGGSSGGSGTSSGSAGGGTSAASGGSASSGTSSGGAWDGSLQGFGSFAPNAIFAVRTGFSDGGLELDEIEIGMFDSDPVAGCATLANGFPLNGILGGDVAIYAKQVGPITLGSYGIVDFTTFGGEATPDGGFSAILVGVATDPPSAGLAHLTGAVPGTGTVTFTSVGPVWAGSFSALVLGPKGQVPLSGNFETDVPCVLDP
jgi:hypothetical protein